MADGGQQWQVAGGRWQVAGGMWPVAEMLQLLILPGTSFLGRAGWFSCQSVVVIVMQNGFLPLCLLLRWFF